MGLEPAQGNTLESATDRTDPNKSGPLAQLVEQLTFNQWVAGSNPARLTTFFKDLRDDLAPDTQVG